MDIFVPPSLKNADASLSLAESFSVLLDPVKRKAIADDIKAHHALNDTEAKKAADALTLIKQHSDILAETRISEDKISKERKDLSYEQAHFKAEREAEWEKIRIARSDAKKALDEAQDLHDLAVDIQNKVNLKEAELSKAKDEHMVNVKKLSDDTMALELKRKEIEQFQKQVIDLDVQTKAKVEKLKQFNF